MTRDIAPLPLIILVLLSFCNNPSAASLIDGHIHAYRSNRVAVQEIPYRTDRSSLLQSNVTLYAKFSNNTRRVANGIKTTLVLSEPLANAFVLQYSTKVPSSFTWGTGGRLPGIRAGTESCSSIAAGVSCWSIQLGWAARGKGQLLAMLPAAAKGYLGSQITQAGTMISIPLANFTWARGAMNTVQLLIATNTPGRADGTLRVKVNGTTLYDSNTAMYLKQGGTARANSVIVEASYMGTVPAVTSRTAVLSNVELFNAESTLPQPKPYVWVDLTEDQKRRIMQLTSIFENSKIELQYGYCENLRDGRGYTFGIAGFTTGTGDGYKVVKEYTARNATNLLAPFLPELKKLAAAYNSSTKGLVGFPQAVAQAALDPGFRSVQDLMYHKMYFTEAMQWANSTGISNAITKGQIFDAVLQHGLGVQDWFSADHIFFAAEAEMAGTPKTGVDESAWLRSFMKHRRDLLLRESGGNVETHKRVDMYEKLLDTGNVNMAGPIYVDLVRHEDGWTLEDIYYGSFQIYDFSNGRKRIKVQ